MHIEDYINTVGKQYRNVNQNFEFRSISALREFIEGAIKNCTMPFVCPECKSNDTYKGINTDIMCKDCGYCWRIDS